MSTGTVAEGPRAATREQTDEVRRQVRSLLEQSPAFRALDADKQRDIAHHTVQVCNYLASPEGIAGNTLAGAQAVTGAARGGRGRVSRASAADPSRFEAQAAQQGAAAAGAYLQAVNFPNFVAQLIQGVFHSIVQSSMEQMEAYGKLVQSVADDAQPVSRRERLGQPGPRSPRGPVPRPLPHRCGRRGEQGEQPRVRLRDGVDEDAALRRVQELPVEGGAIDSLDDDTIEERLVPAARVQLATSRQQLLATMVLMGINRIIVTDGRIAAKVLFDFQARDNFKYAHSATKFDYGDQYRTTSEGEYKSDYEGGSRSGLLEGVGLRMGGARRQLLREGQVQVHRRTGVDAGERHAGHHRRRAGDQGEPHGLGRGELQERDVPAREDGRLVPIGRIQEAARPGQVRATGGTPAPADAGAPPAAAQAPATR